MHKPFLKFAGGKFKLASAIIAKLDHSKHTYVEPFLGSGAIFLNVNYSKYILSDINPDLINLYQTLQKEGPQFIKKCKAFFEPAYNQESVYYQLRDRFNGSTDIVERSILFVYLNRHCFNGLCRYNKKGEFNVPFGRYSTIYFPEKEMLFFWKKSTEQDVTFKCAGFKQALHRLPRNCAVYCDPPYLALTDTANFTNYCSTSFTFKHQKELAAVLKKLKTRTISCVASNHDVQEARKLYKHFSFQEVPVYRAISAKDRSKVAELIIH